MIQLRYLHQMYYTPDCHKCLGADATFVHMVWECPKVRPLWSMVTEFIADNFDLPNICSPLQCLLGLFDQEEVNEHTKLFLRILYFGV